MKEIVVNRLRYGQRSSKYKHPALIELVPDSAGFIEVRRELCCQSTYIAIGLLRQSYTNTVHIASIPYANHFFEDIIVHMKQDCPETLAAIQQQLPEDFLEVIGRIIRDQND